MKRKSAIPPKPIRAPQVPVTVEMLDEMEGRLSHKMDSGLNKVYSEISGVKSELSGVKSEISGIKSELHRVALLVEEQNARNKFVLDGYAQLYELIERKLA
jgi:archaellum component FlaC